MALLTPLGEDLWLADGPVVRFLAGFGYPTRMAVVRLRDGETNLIGGLLTQEDRRSIAGFPGVVDVPLLNKIFADNDQLSHG